MTFKEFLLRKKNIVLIFLAINLFALFVNILGIEGKFETNGKCDETKKITNYFFTDDKYSESEDIYQKNFWPFVNYFYHSDDKGNDWCADPYLGLFRYFDYSEFFVYLIIFAGIIFFYWNSVKDNPLPIKKSRMKNAFWEKLIADFKSKKFISNGLTIPYLVGVMKIKYDMKPNKETLTDLITNLINCTAENKPVLLFCLDINEFVVSLETEEFCDKNFKTEYFFRNISNAKTLYITQNASQLGKTKDELINNLWEKYGEQIQHNLFSWNAKKQQWFPFEDIELQRIWQAEI